MNARLTAPVLNFAKRKEKPVTGSIPMARRQPAGAPCVRILYVEDEAAIRNWANIILTRAGYSVTTAADGWDGWAALESAAFDLVVTDNNMPRLTGMELVGKARMRGLTVPFIIASGFAGCVTSAEIQRLRLAAILEKPFRSEELVATIRQVLNAASNTRQEVRVFLATLAQASGTIAQGSTPERRLD